MIQHRLSLSTGKESDLRAQACAKIADKRITVIAEAFVDSKARVVDSEHVLALGSGGVAACSLYNDLVMASTSQLPLVCTTVRPVAAKLKSGLPRRLAVTTCGRPNRRWPSKEIGAGFQEVDLHQCSCSAARSSAEVQSIELNLWHAGHSKGSSMSGAGAAYRRLSRY